MSDFRPDGQANISSLRPPLMIPTEQEREARAVPSVGTVLQGLEQWRLQAPRQRTYIASVEGQSVRVTVTTRPTLASFQVAFDRPDHAPNVMNILDHGVMLACDNPDKHASLRFVENPGEAD